jgi:signal transduction histidine kinase
MKLSHRLFVLVLLTLAVPVALQVLKEVELRQSREAALRNEALRRVQVTDAELVQVVDSTRQFLATLSQLHSVEANDTALCSPFFERLQRQWPDYALIAVADAEGRVYCASHAQDLGITVRDRPYFQEAMRTGRFVVGKYSVGRMDRGAILPFALPVLGAGGVPHAVVFTGVRLTWLASYLHQSGIPPAATLTVADREGTVLAEVPDVGDAPGQRLDALYLSLLKAGKEGVLETRVNRKDLIVGYSSPAAAPNLFAAVVFRKWAYFAPVDRDTLRDIAGILLATSLALLAAWAIAARFVGRPIRRLVEVGRRWHEGDYTVRANFAEKASEIGQLGTVFDELAEKLHVRERQLRAVAEAKRRLLAAAGHDLRQPLQILTLAMSKLGRKASSAAERRDVARAEKALDKLSSAFDMLVDAARLDSGGLQVQLRRFPINDLLDDIRDEWLPVAEEKGLRLRTVACAVVVESDREMLGTILHNLVGNALKYTEKGGVLIGCRRRRGALSIEVVDTGIGIPQDKIGVIFNEFAQLDPTHAGVGLGLAIVQGTAEILRHPVTVLSVPGKGSRFAVEVPVAGAPAADQAGSGGAPPSLGAPA